MTKFCRRCQQEKPLESFGKDKHRPDGLTSACKECRHNWDRKYRKNNPDKIKAYNDSKKDQRRAYYQDPERKLKFRSLELQRKFGMTHQEYLVKLANQGGVCAICGKVRTSKDKQFMSVDHDHKTGKVRDILCNLCNNLIGYCEENIETLQSAISYLRKYQ